MNTGKKTSPSRTGFWLGWGVAMALLAAVVLIGLPGDEISPADKAEAPTLTRAVH